MNKNRCKCGAQAEALMPSLEQPAWCKKCLDKKMSKKTIAVDFDGVIHKYSEGYHDGSIYDELMEGAKEALFRLGQRYKVVVFSVRDPQQIMEWLDKQNIVVDEVTNVKPKAIVYIDDRGLRFTNWKDMLNYLT